ncbi:hypothetical protein [Alloyangia pacifica]|uniref:hypothetical protein n=1 Tax=Alloyangia pacifica TaxID=311180 RepID=UPI001CD57CBD|nr:hypothetical protein [Alloyangia pacifica]MCA0994789.1 hypothetical protein [Alloyangia pacifica]
MTEKGWHLVGGDGSGVKKFHVLGERSSGTNYIQWAMETATDLHDVNRNVLRGNPVSMRLSKLLGATIKEASIGPYGWKHGIPTFPAIGRRDLVIVSFRNLFDWLVSMYAKPWHICDDMLSLSFSDFIRAEWDARVDRPKRYFDLPNHDDFDGLPLRLDRHPLTGRRYSSILEMRNVKTEAYLGLAELGGNLALVRHDAFTKNVGLCLEEMSRRYGFTATPGSGSTEKRMGSEWKYDGKGRYAAARAGVELERDYILSKVDSNLERMAGFDYRDNTS